MTTPSTDSAAQASWPDAARALGLRARAAARPLANAPTAQRNRVLARLADLLERDVEAIVRANADDLARAQAGGLAAAMIDRLLLDAKRVAGVAKAVRDIAALPDPVGEETERWTRPNGMLVRRVRLPLGVILIIYEARPNVTVDAAALCLKSGNAVLLRGGKEAMRTNQELARILAEALAAEGLPPDACQLVGDSSRELMLALLQQDELIDLAIPRGGEGLIRFVAEHARVPVIKHYKGVCHAYVDRSARPDMAIDIAWDGKVPRPSVCNALECLLVHADIAPKVLPGIARRLGGEVEFRADGRAAALLAGAPKVVRAREDDFGREFLERILAVKVVDSLDEALAHIARYGSLHTEVVVTEDAEVARRFTRDVEASMVGVNVSTRFNDGGELGLGAEMGISTTKLHAFGPMGLRELTAQKFVVEGAGQVRS